MLIGMLVLLTNKLQYRIFRFQLLPTGPLMLTIDDRAVPFDRSRKISENVMVIVLFQES